jgi:hypothetical protein
MSITHTHTHTHTQDACNVGDEGGFAPNIQDNKEGLQLLVEVFVCVCVCVCTFSTLCYAQTRRVPSSLFKCVCTLTHPRLYTPAQKHTNTTHTHTYPPTPPPSHPPTGPHTGDRQRGIHGQDQDWYGRGGVGVLPGHHPKPEA